MARLPQLLEVAKKFDLKIVSIADLIAYRLREESIIERGVTVDMPTQVGDVPPHAVPPEEQRAGARRPDQGRVDGRGARARSVCTRRASRATFSAPTAATAANSSTKPCSMIEREGKGAIVYLNQEGRGIGLCNKIKAYQLQERGARHGRSQPAAGIPASTNAITASGASIIRELGIKTHAPDDQQPAQTRRTGGLRAAH